MIQAEALGGQYYYKGTESAAGALISGVVSPYVQFNDRWSLAPLYSGTYRGTKQVTDIVGGGTLFQDSQEHDLSLKGIRTFANGVKAKAFGGWGTELLQETVDEHWGAGLYDNRRLFGGTEAEWSWDKERYVRATYTFYTLRFPNYQSLESQVTSTGLGRELNQPNVLDNHNHDLTLAAQCGLPGNGYADLQGGFTRRSYGEQHVVDGSGVLTADTRHDSVINLAAEGTWPVWVTPDRRLFASLGYKWTRLISSQNHYDAQQTFFNPNYYSYQTHGLHTQWSLLMGDDPWILSLNGSISRQQYSDRLIQDGTGAYGTSLTHVDAATVGLDFSYPIAKGFRLKADLAWGWDDSNNENNAVYQYHYDTATYLFGFSYAY